VQRPTLSAAALLWLSSNSILEQEQGLVQSVLPFFQVNSIFVAAAITATKGSANAVHSAF
jgi:hypothetical protein